MSTGLRFRKGWCAAVLVAAVLCTGVNATDTAQTHSHKKAKKIQQLPPLPSGPTGRPVQQMPLDSMAAVPPQVSYQNNQLTIVAPNSTLADVLRAIRKQTGAEIEIPSAPDRVVTHLGPGPAREIIAELLNGSRFNYVLLGAPGNDSVLSRVVLVPKTGGEAVVASQPAPDAQQGVPQAANAAPPEPADAQQDADAEPADDTGSDDNTDQQPAEAEQQPPPDQPAVKTPQQMLQEMQQRQMQLQQQQGQAPVPPHPPQEP